MKKIVIATLASTLTAMFASVAHAETARARIADTPIRAERNLSSAVIATLKEGSQIEIVDLQGDYYRVIVPGETGKPRVGYVLVRLIELLDGGGPSQPISVINPASAQPPVAQGAPIPPSLNQLNLRREREAAAEKAAKMEAERLQAELKGLQERQAALQIRPEPEAVEAGSGQNREGFWFNAGLGYGALGCESCIDRTGGASGGLSLGATISDRILLGVGTTGWYKSEAGTATSVGTLDARVRFYPSVNHGLFLNGGLGLGTISVNDSFLGRESEIGLGLMLGLGWDVRISRNVSLTPFWNGSAVRTANADANFGQLGLGITIH